MSGASQSGGESFLNWDYLRSVATAAVAEKPLREIDRVCCVLGAWRKYGRARDDQREGLLSVLRKVVFYRVAKNAIEILPVLDERRDVDAIFQSAIDRGIAVLLLTLPVVHDVTGALVRPIMGAALRGRALRALDWPRRRFGDGYKEMG